MDLINTLHSDYTNFVKHHEIESSTRANDAVERHGKRGTCEAAASLARHAVSQQTCFNEN